MREITFAELDIECITCLIYKLNILSQKILSKSGFSLEGILKNAVIKNGKI